MIIKLVGLFMLVVSCCLVGLSIYEKYRIRALFLQNYTDLIIYLKNEINYTERPIPEILGSYNKSSYLKKYISKLLQNLKTDSLERSWNKAFRGISKENGVLPEEEKSISEFGARLGISDLETQTNVIDYHVSTLKNYLKEAFEARKSKGSLPIVLALCFGLFIAIIFI